jgi:class 3 adenylate cyclase/tetratricopeptide (TPR) repeat protein
MRFCGHCGSPAAIGSPAATGPEPKPDEHQVAEALRSFVAGPVAEKLVEAGGALPQERRLITALFADVSGFTALADRLDSEELLEVIDPVISGLSSVVGRYGGYVEKFAGDALMALFGAPVSHEDDAERALRVGLEMHAELARLVQDLPHNAQLTLHVGINSGHGIARILGSEARMDYAVLGDSVILAQRLESAAPPGETYVSEMTVRLTEDVFEFEPVGELTLKGKSAPVAAWRLVGERAERRPVVRPSLIGREKELRRVDDVLAALRDGHGGLLAIIGEAGIGKSRLTEAALERVAEIGSRRLQARCISYGAGLPYWPYVDLIRREAALRDDEKPAETRARLVKSLQEVGAAATAPFFARLLGLPLEDTRTASLAPEGFRRGLHDAFRRWIVALATRGPVVLALEDLHWADSSSLDLTAELARLTDDVPLLLALVCRPEAREQVTSLARERAATFVELDPLDQMAIGRLAEGILGGVAPEPLIAFVERRSTGNPFFAQELVRALRDSDALVLGQRGWTIRPGWDERHLPPTIEGVLTARIDLLPRDAAALLQTASAIGRRVRLPLLEAVADDGSITRRLDVLVGSGLLDRAEEDGDAAVVFHHALVQDAAYSRLLRRPRRELHLRIAEVAEALYGSGEHVIDLLARHRYLGGDANAVDYLLRAGKRSKKLFANEEAIVHFRRAAELARRAPALAAQLPEILLELADLYELVGNYEAAPQLYEEVRTATGDIRAWRGLASTYRKRGQYRAALHKIDEAIAAEELRGVDLTPLWLESGWTLGLSGRYDQAIDVLQAGVEAVAGRREAIDGHLLLELARAEEVDGRLEEALEHALTAQEIFEERSDQRGLASAMRILGSIHVTAGRLDESVTALRRGLELAERVGSVEEVGGCLINIGLVEERRQAFREAIACDRRAIDEFERVGHASGRARGYANLAGHLMLAGEYDEARRWCERTLEFSRAIGHSVTIADAIDTLAAIELRRSNFAEAAKLAEEAADLYVGMGAPPSAAHSLELARTAWKRAGEGRRARDIEARARSLIGS